MSEGKQSDIGKFVASFIELFDRRILFSKNDKIYTQDIDNLYPNRVEIIERKSVSAFSCASKLKGFIVGNAFEDDSTNDVIVNTKGDNALLLLHNIAESIKTHKGCYLHVKYDLEGKKHLSVLDYKKVRLAKKDDFMNQGKYYYTDWADNNTNYFSSKKKDNKWFYSYNGDSSVISKQIANDGGIKKYRGQVYFINLEHNNIYPYAWLDACLNDADSEFRQSVYKNNQIRKGFLGKTILAYKGIGAEDYANLKKSVKSWLGAENSDGIMTMNLPQSIENISDIVTTITLPTNYNRKQFENDAVMFENNIRKCYLFIPKILISDTENGAFGINSDALKESVKIYNNNTRFIRHIITNVLTELIDGVNWEIKEYE